MTKQIETGCVSGDCFNGVGKRVYEDGSSYEGQWNDGKRSGYGIWKHKNGFYEGEWKNDSFNGRGKEFAAYKDSKKDYIPYVLNDSILITGEFKNDKFVEENSNTVEVSDDLHFRILIPLFQPEIFPTQNEYSYGLSDVYTYEKVINKAFSKFKFEGIQNKYHNKPELIPSIPSTMTLDEIRADDGLGEYSMGPHGPIMTEDGFDTENYNKLCLFFSAFVFLIDELSKNFEISQREFFEFETDETEPLKEKDIDKFATFLFENFELFFNSSKEFVSKINSMINIYETKNIDHLEKIFSKEYAINTRIEDFTVEHDYFPDPLNYPRDYYVIKCKIVNKNYPEFLRGITHKIVDLEF